MSITFSCEKYEHEVKESGKPAEQATPVTLVAFMAAIALRVKRLLRYR